MSFISSVSLLSARVGLKTESSELRQFFVFGAFSCQRNIICINLAHTSTIKSIFFVSGPEKGEWAEETNELHRTYSAFTCAKVYSFFCCVPESQTLLLMIAKLVDHLFSENRDGNRGNVYRTWAPYMKRTVQSITSFFVIIDGPDNHSITRTHFSLEEKRFFNINSPFFASRNV